MSNRVTLAQLEQMEVKEVSALPNDQLELLLEDYAKAKSSLDAQKKKLDKGLELKFAETARLRRVEEGKDTGTVRFEDGEYVIVADLPKKVDWNQRGLRKLIDDIRDWSEDPADYIKTELSVDERRFTAWPKSIQEHFIPSRTVGTGKPTFKLERRAA